MTTGNGLTTLQPKANSLPAAFQGQKAAPIFQGQQIESGAEGLDGSYPIIKYAGKVWSLHVRGEAKPFLRSDDGTPRGSIDVIVVRSAGNKAKTYYEKFVEGSREKPICWSNDGKAPDPSVPTPPSRACASCPKNVFGSRITDDGKKAKACGDHKRLAVVLDPALAQEVLGVPLEEAVLLRVPAASLNDFAIFSQTMEAQGFPLPSFIARIKFDPAKTFPKLMFEAHRPLSPEEGVISMQMRDDAATKRIITDNAIVVEDGAGVTVDHEPVHTAGMSVSQAAPPLTTQQAQVTNGQANQNPNPNVVPLNIAPRQEAVTQQVVQQAAQLQQAQQDVILPRPTPVQQAAAMQPEPGTAPTTDFDAEINAKINGLLA